MPDRYHNFWGGSQICGQSAPPVKATNGKKLEMLNYKFAWISDPAANTMQTALNHNHQTQKHQPQVLANVAHTKKCAVWQAPAGN